LEYKIGRMILSLMEFFQKIKLMDGVYFNILKEIYIKENLKMIKQMDMENIIMKMEEFIQVIGLMIFNTE
jgi:hypothetical protein